MSDAPTSDGEGAGRLVPQLLPPIRSDTPTPVRQRSGLRLLSGVVLLWFRPKSVGASLAQSGWCSAIIAHVLAMMLGLGLVVQARLFGRHNHFTQPTVSYALDKAGIPSAIAECLRAPFAALTLVIHDRSPSASVWSNPRQLFYHIEFGLLLTAVAMMPFFARGEDIRRLFGRSLCLTLWSTTMAIPIGAAVLLTPIIRDSLQLPVMWMMFDLTVPAILVAWWLCVLLRSGQRDTGPAEGPAWEPRIPRCEGCGRAIAGLPESACCQQCDRRLADSLPEKRHPRPFVTARTTWQRARLFAVTLRDALLDRSFFRKLAMRRIHEADTTFFLWLCSLNAMAVFFGAYFLYTLTKAGANPIMALACASFFTVLLFILDVAITGFAALYFAQKHHRGLIPSAILLFYMHALQLGVLVVGGSAAVSLVLANRLYDAYACMSYHAFIIAATTLALLPPVWLTVRFFRNNTDPFRDTRYANA